jgi:hypothetical protein
MDWMSIGIGIGLILGGVHYGVVIGQAIERRRNPRTTHNIFHSIKLSPEQVQQIVKGVTDTLESVDVLNAKEIS